MRMTLPLESSIVHALPGRVRIHLPQWSAHQQDSLEGQLRRLPGVTTAQANPLTGNVLLRFDPLVTTATRLLAATRSIATDGVADGQQRAGGQHDTPAQEDRLPTPTAFPPLPARALAQALTQPAAVHAALAYAGRRVALQTWDRRYEAALEAQEAQEIVARLQAWKRLNAANDGRPSHVTSAIAQSSVGHAERSAERATAQATRSNDARQPAAVAASGQRDSLLRRMLRAFFAPGGPMLALKAASVIVGLARASSPLGFALGGFALGGFELVQLLGETFGRRAAFTSPSGAHSAHLCMRCGAAC